MSVDLSKKRIIMIHGLNSKPPKDDVHGLWKKCILENIRIDNGPLAKQLHNISPNVKIFQTAYWANATPHHIEDDKEYVEKLKHQVKKAIDDRKDKGDDFHVGIGDKIGDFFASRGLDMVHLLTGALGVKDDVMKAFLREVELYNSDQYIADQIRGPLEVALRDAWDNNCEVALLSHSMGTFIAYDVLWRFSHRNVRGFRKYRNKKITLFCTMGSPLGDPVIRDLLFARHHKNKGKRERQYPTNIEYWHNYACLGDVVSHFHDFKEAFFEPMQEIGMFAGNLEDWTRDYTKLHNPFEVVSHPGNEERVKRDPHKSYGYLIQPRLGTWVADFLLGNLEEN